MLKAIFFGAALSAAVPVLAQVPQPSGRAVETIAQPAPDARVSGAPLSRQNLEAFFDGLVPTQLELAGIPGAVVVVVRGPETLLAKGYGYQDVKRKIPVSAERTLFRVGSISKTLTAIAVMQLVEQGKLDLDRNIEGYLDFDLDLAQGPITLRQLLTHTPGLEDTIKNLILTDLDDLPRSLRDRLQLHQPAQVFRPGTIPSYSNYGLSLAGYIVERASGERFEDYIANHIFTPLGMARSSFAQPLPAALARDAAMAYDKDGHPLPYELIPDVPAGAMAATGADMARYMSALLAGGRGAGGAVLRPATLAQMMSRQRINHPGLNALGLAFFEESANGHRIFGHGGATGSFATQMSLVLDENVGFYIAYSGHGGGYPEPALAADRFLERYFPAQQPARRLAVEPPSDQADIEGLYTSTRLNHTGRLTALLPIMGQAEVRKNADGLLTLSVERKPDGTLRQFRAIAPRLYQEVGGPRRLAFVPGPDGRMTLYTDIAAMAFQRTQPLEARGFNLALLAVAVPVLLAAAVSGALSLGKLVFSRRPRAPFSLSRFPVRLPAALSLGLILFCAWLLTRLADLSGLVLFSSKNDAWAVGLAAVATFAIGLSLLGSVAVGLRWVRGETTLSRRVGATVTALACLIASWLFAFWNVASFSVWY